jgi:hypothetical protein
MTTNADKTGTETTKAELLERLQNGETVVIEQPGAVFTINMSGRFTERHVTALQHELANIAYRKATAKADAEAQAAADPAA